MSNIREGVRGVSGNIETLPGALAAEIARVTTILGHYEETQRLVPSAFCGPAIALIRHSIAGAIAAANSSDIVEQARALRDLREYGK